MHSTAMLFRQLAQVGEVHQVVRVLTKAGYAIVAALNDMHGHSREDESERSRHIDINDCPGQTLTEFGL
jgi:hypothetical protein